MTDPITKCSNLAEEVANTITHGIGALLSIAGLAVLVGFAVAGQAGVAAIVAVSIFGAAMFALYTTSALYHAVTHSRVKHILQLVDHSMIYVLIAGSYTPFCLIPLINDGGIWILVAEWTMAIAGIAFQYYLLNRSKWLNCAIYLAMGWLIIVDIEAIYANSTSLSLELLLAGGIVYSLGVIFYVWKKLPFSHAIWHVFVLAGTALQFFAVLQYLL